MIYIIIPVTVTFVMAAINYQFEKAFNYRFFDNTYVALLTSLMTSVCYLVIQLNAP